MKRAAFLMLAAMLLILTACGADSAAKNRYTAYDTIIDHAKPIAMGADDDIHVFCGKSNWMKLEPLMRSTIEREVSLVYQEKYFNLVFADISEVNRLSNYKNLIFIGSLEGADAVSEHIKASLSQDLQTRVRQSGGDLMISKNRFTRDQLIIHLVGLDDARLATLAEAQANTIFSALLDRYTKRLAYQAYQGKVIPADFFEPYPFTLQVPDTYQLYSNDKNNRFLSFLYRAKMRDREIPDKFVSVYYEAMPEDNVDEAWLLANRRRIGNVHFEGDSLDVDKLRTERFKFAGFEGYRLTGAWINPKLAAGGAFQSFGFWDPKQQRAYLVDCMVFFPAGQKLPVLMELFMIASSFRGK